MKNLISILLLIIIPSIAFSKEYFIGGGPDGGTFIYFSNGISEIVEEKSNNLSLVVQESGGSVDNLKNVNTNRFDMGITYSGDLYLGREGRLDRKGRQYRNVHALAYLYGAPAQLVVLKSSGIHNVSDLSFGKKVAVGGIGTGASTAAERFFKSMGIWNKIQPQYLGYKAGSEALIDGQVDALWVFSGFPNPAVMNAASKDKIKILSVYNEASEKSDFLKDYPFYSKVIIPANTYQGVLEDIVTFQDSTLLTANKRIPSTDTEEILNHIYTEDGLAHLVNKKSTAKAMSIDSGLTGIVTPLHKGAKNFWRSQGKKLTPEKPQSF